MSEPTIKDEIFIWLDNNYVYMGYNPTVKVLAEEFDMSDEEARGYFREWMHITY
jgi:hypothetical protein